MGHPPQEIQYLQLARGQLKLEGAIPAPLVLAAVQLLFLSLVPVSLLARLPKFTAASVLDTRLSFQALTYPV